jgi:Condensation domain
MPSIAPSTYLQRRLFESNDSRVSDETVPMAWRLRGALDLDALRTAVTGLVGRHESLRTTLRLRDGRLVQQIGDADLPQILIDLGEDASSTPSERVRRLLTECALRPFDLLRDPWLLRVTFVRLAPDDHALFLVAHHAIVDAWSRAVVLRDLLQLYDGAHAGERVAAAPVGVQLADVAAWEEELACSPLTRYWRQKLQQRIEPPLYPGGSTRAEVTRSVFVSRSAAPLPRFVLASLAELARVHGATAAIVTTAIVAAVVATMAGDRLELGVMDANRDRPELEDVVGCLFTILPIRLDLSDDVSIHELVDRVRDEMRSALAHRLPLGALCPEGSGRRPSYDVTVNYRPSAISGAVRARDRAPFAEPLQLPLDALPRVADRSYIGSSLDFDFRWSHDGVLETFVAGNEQLVPPTLLSRLAASFADIVGACVARPERRLSQLAAD